MRLRNAMTVASLLVPLVLGGCGVLGSAEPAAPSATPVPAGGPGWLVSATGSPTPSPRLAGGTGTRAPLLPPVSFPPTVDPECAESFTVDPVLIAMTIVPGKRSLTATWPRQYDSDYRITAVPQPLASGAQAAYTWKNIPAPAGCTATATITGLTSGKPYVVWLDAPNSGHERDGTRHPYSGKSDVVYPT
jgi:hypothetical protein